MVFLRHCLRVNTNIYNKIQTFIIKLNLLRHRNHIMWSNAYYCNSWMQIFMNEIFIQSDLLVSVFCITWVGLLSHDSWDWWRHDVFTIRLLYPFQWIQLYNIDVETQEIVVLQCIVEFFICSKFTLRMSLIYKKNDKYLAPYWSRK